MHLQVYLPEGIYLRDFIQIKKLYRLKFDTMTNVEK